MKITCKVKSESELNRKLRLKVSTQSYSAFRSIFIFGMLKWTLLPSTIHMLFVIARGFKLFEVFIDYEKKIKL